MEHLISNNITTSQRLEIMRREFSETLRNDRIDARREKLNSDFKKAISNEYIQEQIYKKFSEEIIDSEKRRATIEEVIYKLVELSNAEKIEKSNPLHISKSIASRLISWTHEVVAVLDGVYGEDRGYYFGYEGDELQIIINERSEKQGKRIEEKSLNEYRNYLTKINLIENVAFGDIADYSSKMITIYEMERDYDNKTKGKDKRKNRADKSEVMEREDLDKIKKELFKDYENKDKVFWRNLISDEREVVAAILLAEHFYLRVSSITQITTKDIDLKNEILNLPDDKNKSGKKSKRLKKYVNKKINNPSTKAKVPVTKIECRTQESVDILKYIYFRANNLSNTTCLDGGRKLVDCTSSNIHKEFNRVLDKVGLSGKYKRPLVAIRKLAINELDTMVSEGSFHAELNENDIKKDIFINTQLGHMPKELGNLGVYLLRGVK